MPDSPHEKRAIDTVILCGELEHLDQGAIDAPFACEKCIAAAIEAAVEGVDKAGYERARDEIMRSTIVDDANSAYERGKAEAIKEGIERSTLWKPIWEECFKRGQAEKMNEILMTPWPASGSCQRRAY